IGIFGGLLLLAPLIANGQLMSDNGYSSPQYGFVLKIPPGWNKYEKEITTLTGGTVDRLFVTQTTDLVSRPTKSFFMFVGAPEAIFGVSKTVAQKVSHDELVDFYIDQEVNSSIDFVVTKTYTKGTGPEKVYVIEANYAVPGYRAFNKTYVEFKNDK